VVARAKPAISQAQIVAAIVTASWSVPSQRLPRKKLTIPIPIPTNPNAGGVNRWAQRARGSARDKESTRTELVSGANANNELKKSTSEWRAAGAGKGEFTCEECQNERSVRESILRQGRLSAAMLTAGWA